MNSNQYENTSTFWFLLWVTIEILFKELIYKIEEKGILVRYTLGSVVYLQQASFHTEFQFYFVKIVEIPMSAL